MTVRDIDTYTDLVTRFIVSSNYIIYSTLSLVLISLYIEGTGYMSSVVPTYIS